MQEPAAPSRSSGGRHRKPAPPTPGAAVITTGAFALVPFALSTGVADAAEPGPGGAPSVSPVAQTITPDPAVAPAARGGADSAPVVVPVAAVTPVPSVDWGAIIKCESGNNPKAQNRSSTASGLFQFLDSSWKAYGGGKYASRAKDASISQQTEIAEAAFRRSGLSPWKASQHCWGGKVNTKAKPKTAPEPAKSIIREVAQPIKPATPAKPAAPAAQAAPVRPVPVPTALTGVSLPGLPLPAQLLPNALAPAPAVDRYTVKPGDSLAKIAAERGISWQSLWEANKGSVARPNLLHPGEQLQMPKLPGQL